MKKIIYFLFTSILAVSIFPFLSSCDDKQVEQSRIILDVDKVELPYKAADFKIKFSIENPVSAGVLDVKCVDSWIHDIVVAQTEFSFKVDANDSENERKTTLELSYDNVNIQVPVTQEAKSNNFDMTFDVSFPEIGASFVKVNVKPSNAETPYVLMTVEKAYAQEHFPDDQAIFDAILSQFEAAAQNYGVTLEEFLKEAKVLDYGNVENALFDELAAQTEHYLLAVGMSETGEQLSKLQKVPFTTTEVQQTEISFEIILKTSGADIVMTVKPSDNDQGYYYDLIDKKDMEAKGWTPAEYIQEIINSKVKLGVYLGKTKEEVLKDILSKGESTYDFTGLLEPNKDFIAAAAAVSADGVLSSEVTEKPVTTGNANNDSDFSFVVETSNLTSSTVDVSVTGKPETTLYFFDQTLGSDTAEEVLAELNATIQEFIDAGDISEFIEFFEILGSRGTDSYKYGQMKPNTEYKIYIVAIDEEAKDYATGILFSEPYRTLAKETSSASQFDYSNYSQISKLINLSSMDFIRNNVNSEVISMKKIYDSSNLNSDSILMKYDTKINKN